MGTLDLCHKYFGTRDIYKLLAISRDARTETIRKAYRRLSLLVHPDRVPEQEKPLATEKFKVLSKVYLMLTDRLQRSQYDLRRIVVDDKEEGDDYNAKMNATWLAMWEKMNTPLKVADDERTYVGSQLERSDIKQAYMTGQGCIDFLMISVPYMKAKDEPRLQRIVLEMIVAGEVPPFEQFLNESPRKANRRRSRPERKPIDKFNLLDCGGDGCGGRRLRTERSFNKLLDAMLEAETQASYKLVNEPMIPLRGSKRVVKSAPKASAPKIRKLRKRRT